MSIKCRMNGRKVDYPCSPVCALFGDCVSAFREPSKKATTNMAKNAVEACGFEPNTKVYYIADEYPCENYDTGIIKCLFQPRPDSDAVWAVLRVFPSAQRNLPVTELYHTSDEVKAAIAAKREERRNKYRTECGNNFASIANFMLTYDCVTGNNPIARSVAIEKLSELGISVKDYA